MMCVINYLKHQKLISIGRSCDLLWINLGQKMFIKNYCGDKIQTGEYVLDFQCPWRIEDEQAHVKLASSDMYVPPSGVEWSDTFDWEPQGNNLFDEKIKNVFTQNTNIYVNDIYLSRNGDLELFFSNKLVFRCFVNSSIDEECWRFFSRTSKDIELIITGTFNSNENICD